MAGILYKWFGAVILCVFLSGAAPHPIYVSVTELELNASEKTLEISCKLFTDDFEKVLRAQYKTTVDLINPGARKAAMDNIVSQYVQAHLKITADGRPLNMKYLGYEIIEEGVLSYFEVSGMSKLSNISIFNNLLYEYNEQQMGLMHVTVNGNRKSTKLNYPDTKASIVF